MLTQKTQREGRREKEEWKEEEKGKKTHNTSSFKRRRRRRRRDPNKKRNSFCVWNLSFFSQNTFWWRTGKVRQRMQLCSDSVALVKLLWASAKICTFCVPKTGTPLKTFMAKFFFCWKVTCIYLQVPNQQRSLNKLPTELRRINFVNNHRVSKQFWAKRAKTCMRCVYVPTELQFCIPPLVVV